MRTLLWIVYGVFWIGGVVQGGLAPHAPWTAPLFLLLAALLTVCENLASWRTSALAAAAGFAVELIGVHTGLPFGRYAYTAALVPSVAGVPFAIACAWLVLIDLARSVTRSPLLGAFYLAAIDLVIDPLASGPLHYWTWLTNGVWYGVPWTNFAGWTLVATLILAVPSRKAAHFSWVGLSVVAFFTALAFRYRLWLPSLIGCVLIPVAYFCRRAQCRAPLGLPSDTSYRSLSRSPE